MSLSNDVAAYRIRCAVHRFQKNSFLVVYCIYICQECYRVLEKGLELLYKCEWFQLLFADETALVADSEKKLCKLVSEFGRVCESRKLRVNEGRSMVMVEVW